eukprot:TRINITY_DN10106_c2_g1_i1.p6 TRINITY_DN10106_c2_g1~~TRINITY_DN10106_c2_g1_i1.p6  ORF type:complete len:100 (+),score=3.29 TRINITY_DN10106_c2_g1_i1:246-545(+)
MFTRKIQIICRGKKITNASIIKKAKRVYLQKFQNQNFPMKIPETLEFQSIKTITNKPLVILDLSEILLDYLILDFNQQSTHFFTINYPNYDLNEFEMFG